MKKLILLIAIFFVFSCKRSPLDLAKEICQPYGSKVFFICDPALEIPSADSVSDSSFIVTGQISNSLGVSKIEIFLNNVPYLASGLAPFSRTVTLAQGENKIYAKATLSDNSTILSNEIKLYFNWQYKNTLDLEAGEPIIGVNGSTAYIYSGETNDKTDENPYISTHFYSYNMDTNTLVKSATPARKFWTGNGWYDSSTGFHVLNGLYQIYIPNVQIPLSNEKAYRLNTNGVELSSLPIDEDFRRCGAGQAVVGRKLYIISGWNHNTTELSNKILAYDLDTMTITDTGAELSTPVYNPQVFVYNGKIYIFGGAMADETNFSKKAYTYTPGEGEAYPITYKPFIWHRAGAAVVVKGDKAYVIGGEHYYNQTDNTVKDLSDQVELLTLSPATGIVSSELLVKMPKRMGFFGALYNSGNNKIYTFGGRRNGTFPFSRAIYEYTPEK